MVCAEAVNSVGARVVRHILLGDDGKNVQNSARFRTTLDFVASISGTDQDITPNRVTSFNVAYRL